MGTRDLTSLLPILLLVLLPGPLAAFPDHGHGSSAGTEDGHGGYSYNPPPTSYIPPEPEDMPLVWAPYNNQWAVKDTYAGLDFGQDETAEQHSLKGVYYVLLPDGRKQTVTYHVDKDSGYVAEVTYEQGPVPVPQPTYKPTSPPTTPPQLYQTPEPPSDSYGLPSHPDDPTHVDLRTPFRR